MKNIILTLLGGVILFAPSIISKPIRILGTYNIWINSMCSQNCTIYQLGEVPTTLKLSHTANNKILLAEGILTNVWELPTVAGPRPVVKDRNNKRKVEKFKPSTHSTGAKFLKILQTKNRGEVQVLFRNPFNETLKIRVKLDNEEKYIKVRSKEISRIVFNAKNTSGTVYLELMSSYNTDNFRIDKIKSNGTLIAIKKRIDLSKLKD